MPTFIYALKDPETRKIRYIGMTSRPKKRFQHHLNDVRVNQRTCWIKSLKNRGLLPEMELLVEIPRAEWKGWEIKFIQTARQMGLGLVNGSDGGDGGLASTPQTREKQSAAKLGEKNPMFGVRHSSLTREKISAIKKGISKSGEHRAKISATLRGKPWSSVRRAAYEANR